MGNRSIDQDSVFVDSEGDAWFRRNAAMISSLAIREDDIALEVVLSIEPPVESVLEVGCASGWRLHAVRSENGAFCVGVDVSQEALRDGSLRFPGVGLVRGRASELPFAVDVGFQCVIASFLFHWIDRRRLLRTVAEIDRMVADGGWLAVADFFPDEPTKVPYHHLAGSGIFTYKQDYSAPFTASATYTLERMIVFDHDDPSRRVEVGASGTGGEALEFDQASRAAVWLLKKDLGGVYLEWESGGAGDGNSHEWR